MAISHLRNPNDPSQIPIWNMVTSYSRDFTVLPYQKDNRGTVSLENLYEATRTYG